MRGTRPKPSAFGAESFTCRDDLETGLGALEARAALDRVLAARIGTGFGNETSRHRLSRGGDRSANRPLWRIVLTRLRTDTRTREYLVRRRAEGKSQREVIRCPQTLRRSRGRPRPVTPRARHSVT